MGELTFAVIEGGVRFGLGGAEAHLSPEQARGLAALLTNFADMAEASPIQVVRPLDDMALRVVLDFLRERERIRAIQAYRQHTGAGLKDSKEAVEALADKYDIDWRRP